MAEVGSNVVMSDVQGSLVTLMRPFDGAKAQYQGAQSTNPLNLVPSPDGGKTWPQYENPGSRYDISDHLRSFVNVPRGGQLCIWFPRCYGFYDVGDPLTEQYYQYTFLWRLRSLTDWKTSQNVSYSLVNTATIDNAMTGSGTVIGTPLPCASGPIITPVADTSTSTAWYGSSSAYLAPTNGDIPAYSDLPTHFQPQYITALGDQMGIMVTRVNPSLGTNKWDFTNYTGADWGFSCAYGLENVTSPFSTYSTYKGLYVYSMTGSNQ